MKYRATITVDFEAGDIASLAHHERRLKQAAAALGNDGEDYTVHVVVKPAGHGSADAAAHTGR